MLLLTTFECSLLAYWDIPELCLVVSILYLVCSFSLLLKIWNLYQPTSPGLSVPQQPCPKTMLDVDLAMGQRDLQR